MDLPTIPPERGTALQVWENKEHDFYYPATETTVPQAENLSVENLVGRDWDEKKATDVLAAMTQVPNKKGKKPVPAKKFPTATKFANRDSLGPAMQQTILTNHFELKTHDTTFYEYEVLGLEAEGQTRKKTQALFRKAIAQWDFLKDNQESFATDGQKTIVSWKKLHGSIDPTKLVQVEDDTVGEGCTWEEDISTGRTTSFTARFSFVGPVNVTDLLQQTQCDLSKIRMDLSSVERCINILISKSFDNSIIKLSGKKFYVRSARDSLGPSESLEIIRGYYHAVQPGIGTLLMNFNVATSAFFRPILVADFLKDRTTFESAHERLANLKRLRVYVEHQHAEDRLNKMGARIKTVHNIGESPGEHIEKLSFNKKLKDADDRPYKLANGEWATEAVATLVVQHHLDVFGIKVTTGRPAVNVGTDADPVWYAQEALRIIPYQLYTRPVPDHLTGSMVDKAAYHPAQSQWLIENEGLRQMGFDKVEDKAVQLRNGVPLSLFPTMLKVPSARMPFPAVQYQANAYRKHNDAPPAKTGSGWNLSDTEAFITPGASALKYFIIHQLSGSKASQTIENFQSELKNQMDRRLKMDRTKVTCVNIGGAPASLGQAGFDSLLKQAKSQGADLVVLMLNSPNRFLYAEFKTLADRKHGLKSLCVAKPSQLESKSIGKYMTNIAQKINIKFEGTNGKVAEVAKLLGKDTLVLGADVVHPGQLAVPDAPSIACIVGSVDNQGSRFLGSARLQSKDKKDREIIDHVKEMVVERLRDFRIHTGVSPKNIIYYRDGVSEGQYDQVVAKEVKAIENAHAEYMKARNEMAMSGGKLKITALVGVKRHHTRFYPMTDADKDPRGNQNCLPGTWVDRVVKHPYYCDFYLQSHSGIKGTARPTHYFTLRNDGIIGCSSTEDLKKLTHLLCYTYCRATTGVSYATPTYYADRLCDRARLYLPMTWSGSDPTFLDSLETAKTEHLTSRQTERDTKYRQGQKFDKALNVKSEEELAHEAEDDESLRLYAREYTMTYARKEFYGREDNLTGNPWHTDLNRIMFWM